MVTSKVQTAKGRFGISLDLSVRHSDDLGASARGHHKARITSRVEEQLREEYPSISTAGLHDETFTIWFETGVAVPEREARNVATKAERLLENTTIGGMNSPFTVTEVYYFGRS